MAVKKNMTKIKRKEITCTKCGLIKSVNIGNFFKTDNPLYNEFFPTCKNCVYELFNGHIQSGLDIRNAIIKICELLDRPFIDEVFYSTYEKEKNNKNILGVYFKNIYYKYFNQYLSMFCLFLYCILHNLLHQIPLIYML